jgi:hypothetical protein
MASALLGGDAGQARARRLGRAQSGGDAGRRGAQLSDRRPRRLSERGPLADAGGAWALDLDTFLSRAAEARA